MIPDIAASVQVSHTQTTTGYNQGSTNNFGAVYQAAAPAPTAANYAGFNPFAAAAALTPSFWNTTTISIVAGIVVFIGLVFVAVFGKRKKD